MEDDLVKGRIHLIFVPNEAEAEFAGKLREMLGKITVATAGVEPDGTNEISVKLALEQLGGIMTRMRRG